jgi:signal transduction histidine kinase
MTVDPQVIRSEEHITLGAIVQRHGNDIIRRWAERAATEQPGASRLHHDALLDDLPRFLNELGRSLALADPDGKCVHIRPALEHGKQRWENGWSIVELVRDYQLLRLVLLEYLETAMNRPLTGREAMAIGLALDEAIAASVSTYVQNQNGHLVDVQSQRFEKEKQAQANAHRQQAAALEEINRRKDEFLAMLGHELRNPLAPVRNALQVIRLRGDDPSTRAWVEGVLERQLGHMTRLVDDLLDASRIGRGKILLRRERLDLVKLVRSTADDMRPVLDGAGVTLNLELSEPRAYITGDATRLAQVLGNLLHNASKFTNSGGQVTVNLRTDHALGRVVVSVRDTGIGIAPAALPRLFDMFMQDERDLQRTRGGLGLGLALVKGLVELHGGQVTVQSDGPGHGATFTYWLPLEQAPRFPTPAPTTLPEPPVGALRILLVEDNHDAAESLQVLLQLYGYAVRTEHSGGAAVAAALDFRPDVVLCDLGLPEMDGYAVAAALREMPDLAHMSLIALSGYGSPVDQQRTQDAGFRMHLTKPVDPRYLKEILTKLASHEG